jgi:uncharacterized protein YbaP (TraB family)
MSTRRGLIIFSILSWVVIFLINDAHAKSCLWKVTSDNSILYLQGSIHVLKPENYPLASAIEAAYADSDVLVFETDIKAMSEPETQKKIMAKAFRTKPRRNCSTHSSPPRHPAWAWGWPSVDRL